MNRSLKCILTVILIASVLCGILAPAVSAGFVVQTTTPSGLKPSSCYSAPKYPEPVFTFRPAGSSSGVAHWGPLFDGPPYSVEFHDLTPAPAAGQTIASRYWNFGDGATSTEKDPVHTYAGPGNYTALLSVTTICGSQYTKKIPFSVNTYCTQPVHGFTVDVSEGTAPLTVHVTDTSRQTPASVTTWTYTSSTPSKANYMYEHFSLERNPVFTFSTPGTYTISQSVTKSCTEPAGGLAQKPSSFFVIIKVNPSTYSAVPGGGISQATTTMTTVAPGYSTTTEPALQEPASAGTPAAPASVSGTPPQGSTGAAAAPISTSTGTLSVVTDPAGAAIFLDDVTWGASPASIPNLAAGSHTLRLEKAGYQNMSVPIIVTDGKTAGYSLNLIPENAGTNRAAPLGAAVVIIACAGAGLFLLMRKEHR